MISILARLAVPVAAVLLLVYALVDAISVEDDSMYRAGNKLIWVLVILLLPVFIGPLIYLSVGRPARPRSWQPRQNRPPPDDII